MESVECLLPFCAHRFAVRTELFYLAVSCWGECGAIVAYVRDRPAFLLCHPNLDARHCLIFAKNGIAHHVAMRVVGVDHPNAAPKMPVGCKHRCRGKMRIPGRIPRAFALGREEMKRVGGVCVDVHGEGETSVRAPRCLDSGYRLM